MENPLSELYSIKAERDSLKTRLTDEKAKTSLLEAGLKKTVEERIGLKARLVDESAKIVGLETRLKYAEAERDMYKDDVERKAEELARLKEKQREVERVFNDKLRDLVLLKAKQKEAEAKRDIFKKKHDNKEGDANKLAEDLSKAEAEYDGYKDELFDKVTEVIKHTYELLVKTEDERDALHAELADGTAKIAELEAYLKKNEDERDHLKTELAEWAAEIAELEAYLKKIGDEYDICKDELKEKTRELMSLKERLEDAETQIGLYIEKVNFLEKANEELEKEIKGFEGINKERRKLLQLPDNADHNDEMQKLRNMMVELGMTTTDEITQFVQIVKKELPKTERAINQLHEYAKNDTEFKKRLKFILTGANGQQGIRGVINYLEVIPWGSIDSSYFFEYIIIKEFRELITNFGRLFAYANLTKVGDAMREDGLRLEELQDAWQEFKAILKKIGLEVMDIPLGTLTFDPDRPDPNMEGLTRGSVLNTMDRFRFRDVVEKMKINTIFDIDFIGMNSKKYEVPTEYRRSRIFYKTW